MAKTDSLLPASDPADFGTFDPTKDGGTVKPPPYTIPALAAFRDSPSVESHTAAARFLHRCGTVCLDGVMYSLVNGKVKASKPVRNPYEVVKDDPNEVI
jgi:hypothetical protein